MVGWRHLNEYLRTNYYLDSLKFKYFLYLALYP